MATTKKQVTISGEVHLGYSEKAREWSGFDDTVLVFEKPKGGASDLATFDLRTHRMTVNPEPMVLNPNRLLRTFTPFRMRQEAVLTGAVMHEAAHARYSQWRPTTEKEFNEWRHSDGTKVSEATWRLANLLEEPRIEARMAIEAESNGTAGLEWTLRAMAAHLIPMTQEHLDPNQQLMDLITSYVLRAGRPMAFESMAFESMSAGGSRAYTSAPPWAADFESLVWSTVVEHMCRTNRTPAEGNEVLRLIRLSLKETQDTGTVHIDRAREILDLLYPDLPEDARPTPQMGVCGAGTEGSESEGSESEGSEGSESEGSGATGSTNQTGDSEPSDLMKRLREQEKQMIRESISMAQEHQRLVPSLGAGADPGGDLSGGFRKPTAEERQSQTEAERFLRDLLDPSEAVKIRLSETPSAQVDGAALAAWRASGADTTPMFFRRAHREVVSAPPVKIAILVDVSSSMESLQGPSALLSWALASAAVDMRNFAGRGRQIESCLVHWGSSARVIQPVGEAIPGIREVPCDEGTRSMGEALQLVEEQMPGFLDPSAEPESRLLVQFTDWELSYVFGFELAVTQVRRALDAGVNMLSVLPRLPHMSRLNEIVAPSAHAGQSRMMVYNPGDPGAVWAEATKILTEKR